MSYLLTYNLARRVIVIRIIWIKDVKSKEVKVASEAFFLCIFTLLSQGGTYFTRRILFCFGAKEKAYMVYRHIVYRAHSNEGVKLARWGGVCYNIMHTRL